MGRLYSLTTGFQSVSAAQDLVELKAGTARPFLVHYICIGQSSDAGDAESELLQVTLKRAASTFTSGSGGGSLTAAKYGNTTDAADGFGTEERNNTTQAVVGTGTLTNLLQDTFHVSAGWQYLPTPVLIPLFSGGEALVISVSAPADALTMSCTVIVEEFG